MSTYDDDLNLNLLSTQLQILKANIPNSESGFRPFVSYFRNITPSQRHLHSEIVTLLKLILVAPATNACSERSFSTLRRIKSWLRNTTKQDRLNSQMILIVHFWETDTLDLPT